MKHGSISQGQGSREKADHCLQQGAPELGFLPIRHVWEVVDEGTRRCGKTLTAGV